MTAVVALSAAGAAVWVMVRQLGLNDELDFGAGAYYYADIPEFDKVLDTGSYVSSLPLGLAIVLFLLWGALMYALWKRMDRSHDQ
ncbi:MAG: hypothetical protein IKX53_03085 [Bacteroidales bacterium]|nr:hypothetical protein [Bacteroidales bacterium]